MIDDEANFDNILDTSEQVQTAAKFQPKKRSAKPRKASQPSKSAARNPTVQTGDRNAGALNQFDSSKGIGSQERASLMCPGSEAVDNLTGSQSIPETPSEDVVTAPLGPLPGAFAADRISQDNKHNDDSSNLATHQENMVVSDIHVSPASACGRTIDDIIEFGETFDAQTKEERVAKFQPKVQAKLLKATTKSQKTNKKVEASTVDVVTHNGSDNNMQTILHDEQAEDPRSHKSVQQTPDSEGLFATDMHISEVGNLANLDSFPEEESVEEETSARFRPKLRPRPAKASSKVAGANVNVAAATPMVGTCADNNDMCTKTKDQETMPSPAPQDVHATIDLDSHNELIDPSIDGSQSIVGEVSAVPTSKSPPTIGREKDKSKSVSFALSDASGVFTPTDANSEMGSFGNSCNNKLVDKNLSNSSQKMAERHYITEEQHSNDQADNECGYHEGEPLDPVEQQPKSNVGEVGSSMKLRSRKGLHKTLNHTADDYFGEDCVEPLLAEGDNVSGDEYTAVTKRKVRKKSRDGVQESQQQKVQKDKSQISSRGRKRTLKDDSAEKPEKKKLTHRIRRTKEVKTLLETPREEIDPMKLSAAHLRLLQEARERVNPKQIPSEPTSNTSNFQFEDMDDFDYRDDEARNFDNDRTENHVPNATKLNYHSYMNKPTRGKWSKSDTDLFYQGLRQFGSDFAMIQQLFPDKTRHQVRQKFKSEERKNPLLVHDAIIHRSRDNQYFKKVIKQLNIEDVLPEINNTHKQDGASSEGGPGNENVLDDFTNDDFTTEGDGSNAEVSGVQEEHVSRNDDDDDLGDVFDWY